MRSLRLLGHKLDLQMQQGQQQLAWRLSPGHTLGLQDQQAPSQALLHTSHHQAHCLDHLVSPQAPL